MELHMPRDLSEFSEIRILSSLASREYISRSNGPKGINK